MVLLEDHLNDPGKHCRDCIRKHFITIEAFIEEGNSLDKTGKWKTIFPLAEAIRNLGIKWEVGMRSPRYIAQRVRLFRKGLLPMVFLEGSPAAGLKVGSMKLTLASLVADAHMARVAKAEREKVMVFLNHITGAVALWGIRQSPYDFPENLEVVIQKLSDILRPKAETIGRQEILWFNDRRELYSLVDTSLKAIPEFEDWNVPVAERGLPEDQRTQFAFISMYDSGPEPDHDFIDLDAVVQNVVHMVWVDATEDDGIELCDVDENGYCLSSPSDPVGG